MKICHSLFIAAAVCVSFLAPGGTTLRAADRLELQAGEGIAEVLTRHQGKSVKLILVSSQELMGTVTKVNVGGSGAVVHLSALSGAEFYDAVVRVEQINAVVIRTK